MTHVLALDTATLVASSAVVSDGRVVAERDARVTTHSEKLLPLVDELLAEARLEPAALDLVACGAGPGSFTGLRIGLATAKGLAFALGKPLVVASSLAALALEAEDECQASGALALALLDAKKQEVYAGLYHMRPEGPIPVGAERVIGPEALVGHVSQLASGAPVVVVGDGAAAYPDAAARCGRILAPARGTPRARAVARLALARVAQGTPDELATAAPTYIRASEAELKWDGR